MDFKNGPTQIQSTLSPKRGFKSKVFSSRKCDAVRVFPGFKNQSASNDFELHRTVRTSRIKKLRTAPHRTAPHRTVPYDPLKKGELCLTILPRTWYLVPGTWYLVPGMCLNTKYHCCSLRVAASSGWCNSPTAKYCQVYK